jgi:hypothetical protein
VNELQIKVKQSIGKIEFNFEESKAILTENLKEYKGIIITSDTVGKEKKEVAYLRSQIKVLEDARKKTKKECLKPYEEFEPKEKEMVSLIEDAVKWKNDQLEVFENKRIEEKKEKIQKLYEKVIGDLEKYLPLSKLYNTKWENSSTTMKSVQDEMETVISSTDMAINTIKGMNSEVVDKALEQFKQDLSLANAIAYITNHDRLKAEILAKEEQKRKDEEERKRLAENERVRAEERERIAEEERIKKEAIEEERKRAAKEIEVVEEFISPQNDEVDNAFIADGEPLAEEEPFEAEEEPLEFTEEEPFAEEKSFDITEELPFAIEGEITTRFIVVGTIEEMEQIEIYMNSIGVIFERRDI